MVSKKAKLSGLHILGLLALGSLTACFQTAQNPASASVVHDVEVESTTLQVGESAEVTLSVEFVPDEDFKVSELNWAGFKLGACFSRTDQVPENSESGFCTDGEKSPTPTWMVVSNPLARSFDDFVIKRGESRRFEHTVTFTPTEPGEMYIASNVAWDNAEPPYEPGAIVEVVIE